MKKIVRFPWIVMVALVLGCAHPAPVTYFSKPEVGKITHDFFEAQIEILKLDNPFYVAFQLTVMNKSNAPLEIDWNKTRYLIGTEDNGVFVFEGIDPETLKTGIPKELVAPGQTLSKQIMPRKTLAFAGRKEAHRPGKSNFYPGILPNGRNTVGLVLAQGSREWKVPMPFQIGTREVKK
jgi:hypothetical protein